MEKLAALLISLISIFFSGCGSSKNDILPVPFPSPSAIILESDNTDIEQISIEELKTFSNGNFEVLYSPSTGIPRQIDGFFASLQILSEQDALKTLLSMRTIFKIPEDCSFTCIDLDDNRIDLQVYTLNQLYMGILVDGGQFRVVTTKDGFLVSISGVYQQVDELNDDPIKSASECVGVISRETQKSISSVSLVIHKAPDGKSHLCWRFEDFSHLYFIDAQKNELLETISTVID